MCLNPIKLDMSLQKRYYNLGDVIKKDVIVPCGKCWQCQTTARNALLLRVREEYDECIKKGGKVAFVTFTYRDEDVPCYTYRFERVEVSDDSRYRELVFTRVSYRDVCNGSYDDNYVFGFDKLQFRNFMKVLRQVFARFGYKGSLRYIVVSEYGTDPRYTQRPHYHALFFLDSEALKYLELSKYVDLIELCQKYWKYGIVSASDKGLYLENKQCCEYVAKYVSKANELLKLANFRRLFDKIKLWYNTGYRFSNDVKPGTYFSKVCRSFGLSYFVLKSLYFGLSVNERVFNEDVSVNEFVDRLKRGVPVVKYGEVRFYPYPAYNVRKLLYSNRSDGSYFLSPLGVRTYITIALTSYFQRVESIRDYFDKNYSTLVRLTNSVGFKDAFEVRALSEFLRYSDMLVFYDMFIRGRMFPVDVLGQFVDFLYNFYTYRKDFDSFVNRLHDAIRVLLDSEIFDEDIELPSDSLRLHSVMFSYEFNFLYGDKYNSLQNSAYDFLIDNYSAARAYHGRVCADEYSRLNADLKLIRDIVNDSKY